MKSKTKIKPSEPANKLLLNESEPSDASTFLSWTKFNPTGKAPDFNWIDIVFTLCWSKVGPWINALPPDMPELALGAINCSPSKNIANKSWFLATLLVRS